MITSWNPDLETGVELIDNQHAEIIKTLNTYFIRQKCNFSQENIYECLKFVQQFVMYHFQCEEAYMVECDYPNYRSHQALHNLIATQVKFFSVKMETEADPEVVQQFDAFLENWIGDHILIEDIDFVQFYKNAPGIKTS